MQATNFAVVMLSAVPSSVSTLQPNDVAILGEVVPSLCILDPQIFYLWTLHEKTTGNLVSLPSSIRKNLPQLVLPPDTLQPGTSYQATVVANYSVDAVRSGALVVVDIEVGRSPISAQFRQGESMKLNLPLTLDVDAVDPDATSEVFTYTWSISKVSACVSQVILSAFH